MNFLQYKSSVEIFLQDYASCSLINADGALLYSKDNSVDKLTTTRLVSFQIVKKYLNPQPSDIFVLNDPENGGYQQTKLIFISCITQNLYLIWDEDYASIDYKIPPTPLYDQGKKNEFVWQALVAANKHPEDFDNFLEYQKHRFDKAKDCNQLTDSLTSPKNQQQWLKASQRVFDILFSNKAHGSYEAQHRLNSGASIKLKFSAEEKQNLKTLIIDFTNTQICSKIHAASHVIESALVKKIIDFYGFNEFFTQSILDKIRVLLPPKSIVSKSHPTGSSNYELQAVCSQMCEYNLLNLNSHQRKNAAPFVLSPFLGFDIYSDSHQSRNFLTSGLTCFQSFEELADKQLIQLESIKKSDQLNYLAFQVRDSNGITIRINNHYVYDKSTYAVMVNKSELNKGSATLAQNDRVEVIWKQS